MGLSEKQKKIFAFPQSDYDALICDGAIRSGKTLWMTVAFIDDAMHRYNGQRFGICGKTVDSATKNIIEAYLATGIYNDFGFNVRWRRTDKILEVRQGNRTNVFEVFGGKDESSYTLIQGRTLAGVLFDEVALMPRSFVDQATARCSVAGSKLWFNCNPAGQLHWFNQEWVEHPEKHNALHLHFTMDDNPSLTEAVRHRYETMYSGVFYERYILGLWVAAEGLIYDMFQKRRHVISIGKEPELFGDWFVSCDFGIQNATVFLLWRRIRHEQEQWFCADEWRWSGREEERQKTVSQLADGLDELLGRNNAICRKVIIDPSASALSVELKKRRYAVKKADNNVLDGISGVSMLLEQDRLYFSARCKGTIDEFGVYRWDDKAEQRGEDKPIKENDHAMDAVRYFVQTMRLTHRRTASSSDLLFL